MPKLLQLSSQQSTLPAWVRAMTQGAVGPGDLSNPMEGPLVVAAQSPALMRKMGEALLERLSKRGDIPENLMKVLRDIQGRYPRVFGHVDDVKVGGIQRTIGSRPTVARMSDRAGQELEPRHMIGSEPFDPDVDNPMWSPQVDRIPARRFDALAKEQNAATRTTNKYSTLHVDPSLEHTIEGGMPVMVGHEMTHGAQRIADPSFLDKYRQQFAANTELTKDPFEGYQAISYEKNANLGGERYAKRFAGEVRPPLAGPLSPHPTLDQIRNKYNREALIEQMARKLSGGQ